MLVSNFTIIGQCAPVCGGLTTPFIPELISVCLWHWNRHCGQCQERFIHGEYILVNFPWSSSGFQYQQPWCCSGLPIQRGFGRDPNTLVLLFAVRSQNSCCSLWPLKWGVLQGSELSSMLFNFYIKSLNDVIRRRGLWCHLYVDDIALPNVTIRFRESVEGLDRGEGKRSET